MSVKDETEIQNLSQQPSQGQLVPGDAAEDTEKSAKPAQKTDITNSETAVGAKTTEAAGGKKKCMIAVGIFLVLAIAAVVVVFLVVLPNGGDRPLSSRHYDVFINDFTRDIVLSPKKNDEKDDDDEAIEHKNTLIWLHGRESSAKEAAMMFAKQEKDQRLTPDTTKIIIPQSQHTPDPPATSPSTEEKPAESSTTPEKAPEPVELTQEQKDENAKLVKEALKKKEEFEKLMPSTGSYKLSEKNKERTGDEGAAFWQSEYNQDDLSAQADILISSMIKTELEILSKKENFNAENNKVYIGGFSEGGALALATFLKMKFEDRSNGPIISNLGGVISISGIQALAKYDEQGKTFKGPKETSRNKKKSTWKTQNARLSVPLFVYNGKEDANFAGVDVTVKTTFTEDVYKFAIDDAETTNNFTYKEEDGKAVHPADAPKDSGKLSPKAKKALADWLNTKLSK